MSKIHSVLFAVAIFIMQAQNILAENTPIIDSLLQKLKSVSEDTLRVKVLDRLCYELKSQDPGKAIEYGNESLTLAKRLDFKSGIGKSLNHLGMVHALKGESQVAASYSLRALDVYKQLEDRSGMASCYLCLGIIDRQQGNYISAINFYLKAVEIHEETDNRNEAAACFYNLGNLFYTIHSYQKAIEYFNLSHEYWKELGDSVRLGKTLLGLGLVYKNQKRYELAKDHLTSALSIFRTQGYRTGEAHCLTNIGIMFQEKEKFEEALEYFELALDIYEKHQAKQLISRCLVFIGDTYSKVGKYRKAIDVINRSLAIAQEIGAKELIGYCFKVLSETSARQGEYKNAYSYHLLESQISDSILNETTSKQIAELEAKYLTQKKQQQIEKLENENQIQALELNANQIYQYTMVGGLLFSVLFIFIIYSRYVIKIRSNKLLKESNDQLAAMNQEVELQKQKMELKALLAQMNPHFIFNSLNSIQKFITNNDKESAHNYLSKFGQLIRAALENSNKNTVPISDELETLKVYVDLERLRVEQDFDFSIEIDPSLDIYNLEIAPMLIQPLVENAIWHGIMNNNKKGVIDIKLKLVDDGIRCIVEDNGIGRKKALELKNHGQSQKNNSSGMEITIKRLEALWSQNENYFYFKVIDLSDVNNLPSGTRVEFSIPTEF